MLRGELPQLIQNYMKDSEWDQDSIGCSRASVYCLKNQSIIRYLKVEKSNRESENEHQVLQWLQGKLPVPKIIAQCRENGYDYLLLSNAYGEMACSEANLSNIENLVQRLAEGIHMLQQVEITHCPFNGTIGKKLEYAKERIEHNKINMNEWDNDTFSKPIELYEYLVNNQPTEELVFTHGDYCLPNIFFNEKRITGFIDLGRAGVGDKWQDIALCVRSLEYNFKSKEYTKLLFECLGYEPNYEKIRYYRLLDELF